MKIIIAKDDNLQTVGIRIFSVGTAPIFQWGVEPLAQYYYVRELSGSKWEAQIITLISLAAKHEIYSKFESDFFNVADNSNVDLVNKTFNFSDNRAILAKIDIQMTAIIKNFK